jgi:hypothetical protein
MTSNDPRASALLDAFRRQRALAPTQRAAIWSQIEATLETGDPAATLDAGPRPPTRMPIAWIAAAALAAGVVLGIAVAPHAATLVETSADRTQAVDVEAARRVHGAVDRERPAPMPVAVPPEPGSAPPIGPAIVAPTTTRPAARSPRAQGPTEPANTDDTDALVIESALLRRAHRALRAGDPQGALAILDAHAQAFPSGQMLEDRLTLRIEALCAAGDRSQARAEAIAMRRRFPGASIDACVDARSNADDTDR